MSLHFQNQNSPADSPPADLQPAWSKRLADFATKLVRTSHWTWTDLLVIVGALGVATIFRFLFDPLLGYRTAHATYVIAVLIIAWARGLWPALLTGLIGSLLAAYLFLYPRYTLGLKNLDDQVTMALNFVVEAVATLLIVALRNAVRENAELYQRARLADIRKDEFLAMISHELRNPLVPIQNAVYILSQTYASDESSRTVRDLLERQVSNLIRLVDDLLDVSRITRGKIDLRKCPVELATIIDGAVESVYPAATEKKQTLSVNVPQRSIVLNADPLRLTQVFSNLLNNAVKYTKVGGNIWLSTEQQDNRITVRVRDDGIGIAAGSLDKIFELFEQAGDELTLRQGGLGIGLTIVDKLVELHDGTVEAHSPGLGLGSEFVVSLPVATSGLRLESSPVPHNKQTLSEDRSRRILVVDDNVASANSMALLLKYMKQTVHTSYNAFSALEAARSFRPDIVLADIGLPQMNGFEFARQLRLMPEFESTLLVAVTGYGQSGVAEAAKAAGFDRYLVKPVNPHELEQLIASAV